MAARSHRDVSRYASARRDRGEKKLARKKKKNRTLVGVTVAMNAFRVSNCLSGHYTEPSISTAIAEKYKKKLQKYHDESSDVSRTDGNDSLKLTNYRVIILSGMAAIRSRTRTFRSVLLKVNITLTVSTAIETDLNVPGDNLIGWRLFFYSVRTFTFSSQFSSLTSRRPAAYPGPYLIFLLKNRQKLQ